MASVVSPRPALPASWVEVLERIEASLGQMLASSEEPVGDSARRALPDLPLPNDSPTELDRAVEAAERGAGKADRILEGEDAAAQLWLARLAECQCTLAEKLRRSI